MSSVHISNCNGTPIILYNDTVEYDGFYISYNDYDIAWYGSDTTALVVGQMEKFYILDGNHMKQYMEIAHRGFDKCLDYFKAHIDQINKHSIRS